MGAHLILALWCVVFMMACYGSEGLTGHADSTTDPFPDPGVDSSDTVEDETAVTNCGNGLVDDDEECDDGDLDECNGCTTECTWERALSVGARTTGAMVSVVDIPCLTCPFTFEAWFRLDDYGSGLTLFDIPGFIEFTVWPDFYDYSIGMGGGGGVWSDSEILEPGTWHHVALVCFDSGRTWDMTHFLDGDGDFGGLGWDEPPIWPCTETMRIGSAMHSVSGSSATMDDLRISNEALYTWGTVPFTPERSLSVRPDTEALWDFNQEFDGWLYDASGNRHHAYLADALLVPDDCHLP